MTSRQTLWILAFIFAIQLGAAEKASSPSAPAEKVAPASTPITKIIGQLIDWKTKKPLAAQTVTLTDDPYYGPRLTEHLIIALPGAAVNKQGQLIAVTKEDGMFEISFTTTSKKQMELGLLVITEAGAVLARQQLTAYQGETLSQVPMEVALPLKVTAQIVDDKKQPVAGAIVRANGFTYTSDAQGYFTDLNVPAHRFSWDVVAPGFELMRSGYWIGDGVEKPVIELIPCKAVTGKVLDADGKPMKGMRVQAGTEFINQLPNWFTVTDENGEFTVRTALDNGQVFPIFPASERDALGDVLRVKPGQTDVVLKLFPMGRLEISAKDAQGQPLVKQQIQVVELGGRGKYRWAQTDEKGELEIDPMPAGEYQVNAPYVPQEVPQKQNKVTVTAHQTAKFTLACAPVKAAEKKKLSGVLLDSNGQPILHAQVLACYRSKADPKMTYQEGRATTELDGHFEMELSVVNHGMRDGTPRYQTPLPAGDDKVRIVAYFTGPDVTMLDETRDWAAADAKLDVGTLKASLEPERMITLIAEHNQGGMFKPVLTQVIDAQNKALNWRLLPNYNPESRKIQIAVRYAGVTTAKLTDDSGENVNAVIPDLKGDQTLNIMFPDLRAVDFLVLDPGGKPLKSVMFYPRDFPKSTYKGFTIASDKDGKIHFECSTKDAGRFILYGSLNYEVYEGTIAAGEKPLTQTLQLTASNSKLTGLVRDGNGNPIPKAQVYMNYSITDRMSSGAAIDVKEDGTYSLFVPKNTQVSLQGSAMVGQDRLSGQTKQIVVAEGKTETLDLVLRAPQLPGRIPVAMPKVEKPTKPVEPPLEF